MHRVVALLALMGKLNSKPITISRANLTSSLALGANAEMMSQAFVEKFIGLKKAHGVIMTVAFGTMTRNAIVPIAVTLTI